jgi:DNA-binding NarL/FixJ family response regulator
MKSMFQYLKRHQKDAKILVCGENKSRVFEIPLINMGAHGFILKSGSEKDFVMAIEIIQTGHVYISQKAINANLSFNGSKSMSPSSSLDSLSTRELDVYKLLSKGESVKNICEILELHQSTVSTLKKRVMAKLGVNNIVDMIKMVED